MKTPAKPKGLNFYSVLIILIIATVIGVGLNYSLTKPANKPQIQLADPGDNWKKIVKPNVMFFSEIFLDRSKTFIYIPIKFDQQTQISWLGLDSTSSAQPKVFLVTHPALEGMNWSKLSRGTVNLFQRKKSYSSIEALVTNTPPANKIAIDPAIRELPFYQNLTGESINESLNLDTVDYLLTTYTQPKKTDDAFHYQNTVDASYSPINQSSKLTWQLNVPNATDSAAFYIGEIHVDYRR